MTPHANIGDMLDPRSLVVLHLVNRTGSLSAAARELGWTHPAVSQHVKRLERAAGLPLVERHGRGVRLTPAGTVLAGHAADMAAALTAATASLPNLAHTPKLRVAAFPTACATLLVDALTAIDLQVDLRQAEPPEALAALQDGTVDLAITFHDSPPPGAALLGRDPILVALPPHIPWRPRTPWPSPTSVPPWSSPAARCARTGSSATVEPSARYCTTR
ncbi:hypothetical protein GCM10029964_040170 [Kibdelosporangium lantanae]